MPVYSDSDGNFRMWAVEVSPQTPPRSEGMKQERPADLGKVMVDAEDVMTPEDVVSEVEHLYRYRKPEESHPGDGARLEQDLWKVVREVRGFEKKDSMEWLNLGLTMVTGDAVDFTLRKDIRTRESLLETLRTRVAEDSEEGNTWLPNDIQVAEAWIQASPYTLFCILRDLMEVARECLEEGLFDMANTDHDSLGFSPNKHFMHACLDWREKFVSTGGLKA